MLEILNLGKQLESLVNSFFTAIEKYDELKIRRRKNKKQLEFGEAYSALFGVHHAPGWFGEFLTGGTTFCENHHRIVMEKAKDESAMIQKHQDAIHAAVAELDIKIAVQLDKILTMKRRIYDCIAADYDKMDEEAAHELGRHLNRAYEKLTESISNMQKTLNRSADL